MGVSGEFHNNLIDVDFLLISSIFTALYSFVYVLCTAATKRSKNKQYYNGFEREN